MAWQSDSPLWLAIGNVSRIPSCEEVTVPQNIEPISSQPSSPIVHPRVQRITGEEAVKRGQYLVSNLIVNDIPRFACFHRFEHRSSKVMCVGQKCRHLHARIIVKFLELLIGRSLVIIVKSQTQVNLTVERMLKAIVYKKWKTLEKQPI